LSLSMVLVFFFYAGYSLWFLVFMLTTACGFWSSFRLTQKTCKVLGETI
jgi:hypothetical protein